MATLSVPAPRPAAARPAAWRLTAGPFAALALTLLAFALRAANLGGQSLWYDEAYQTLVAATPLSGLLAKVASDTNQPFAYLVLHFWGAATASEFYLRFPSVLAGTVAVPLLYAMGRVVLPARAALAGAAALALSPFAVFYSQEGRMYAQLLAWAALAGYGFAAAWVAHRPWGWAVYAAATAGALYTHALGALPCLALVAWPVVEAPRQPARWRAPALALLGACAAFLPWGLVMAGQATTVLATFWAPSPSLAAPLLSLHQLLLGPFLGAAPWAAGLALVLTTLALTLPHTVARGGDRRALGRLWVWALLPVFGLFVLSQGRSVYLDRVLIGAGLPLCLLAGWALTTLRPPALRVVLGGGLLALACLSLAAWYAHPAVGKPPYRRAAQAVLAGVHPGEPVLHSSDGSLLPFLVYAPDLANVLLAGDPEHAAPTSRARSTLGVLGMMPQGLTEAIAGHDSFWLVVAPDHSVGYQQAVAADVDARYRRLATADLGGLQVRRYAR